MYVFDRANPDDDAQLHNLIEVTFLETWTGLVDDRHISDHLNDGHASKVKGQFFGKPGVDVFVVRDGLDLVGYAIGYHLATGELPDFYKIEKLYLHSSVKGIGIGSSLWNLLVEHAKASGAAGVYLTHYPHNVVASRFYEKVGLCKVGETTYRCGDGVYNDWILAADWQRLNEVSKLRGVKA